MEPLQVFRKTTVLNIFRCGSERFFRLALYSSIMLFLFGFYVADCTRLDYLNFFFFFFFFVIRHKKVYCLHHWLCVLVWLWAGSFSAWWNRSIMDRGACFSQDFRSMIVFIWLSLMGYSALIGSVLIVELIFLGMQSEPTPQQIYVSHAYGKDFICSFQDDAQKRKRCILESDLNGHQCV